MSYRYLDSVRSLRWRLAAAAVPFLYSAVCDMRTVSVDELIPARLGENSLEIFMSVVNPAHKWHYFPEMTRDEVLLIKTYDSAEEPVRHFPA